MKLRAGGFTIVETLIVLAVATMVLTTSVIAFSGQQAAQQYELGTKDIETKIQDVLNDVSTGNYGAQDNYTCTPDSMTGPILTPSSTRSGTNTGCIYVGKAIQFGANAMSIVTLVGNRMNGANPSSTFNQTKPKVVPASLQTYEYKYGVQVYGTRPAGMALTILSTTPNNTGFVNGQSKNGYVSGTQLVLPYVSGLGASVPLVYFSDGYSDSVVEQVARSANLTWPANGKVRVCMQDSAVGSSGRHYNNLVITSGAIGLSVTREKDEGSDVC